MVDERWENNLIGGYRLQQQAAKDRLGTLYEAVHEDTTYPAWLKVFHTPHTRSQELQARYNEGIPYLTQFRHHHLAQIYHADYDPQFGLYVILERVEGHPLDRVLEQKIIPPPLRPLPLFLELLDGLQKLHQASLIHGDLRPANIILGPSETNSRDQLQALDFGQSWWWDDRLRKAGGYAPESAFYMPPEQLNGEGALDHRIDIFAAGVLLAEMLMRRRLFDGSLAKLRDAQKDFFSAVCADLEKERKNSKDLEEILRYALAEKPNHRYASIQEFADALRESYASILEEEEDEYEATGRFSGFDDDPLGLEPSEATVVHRISDGDDDYEDMGPQTQRIDLEAEGLMAAMDSFGQRAHPSNSSYGSPAGGGYGGGYASGGYNEAPAPSESTVRAPIPQAMADLPANALTGGRDPLDVTLVGQKKGKPQSSGSSKGLLYFGITFAVLIVAGIVAFQFLPPTPSKNGKVDPDKQIFVKLQLHSVPAGAEIWLGGNKQESTTPAELSVRIGRKVQIQLRKEGYLPHLFHWIATSDTYQNVPLKSLGVIATNNTPNTNASSNNSTNASSNNSTNASSNNSTNASSNNTSNNNTNVSSANKTQKNNPSKRAHTSAPRTKPRVRRSRRRQASAMWGGLPTATLTLRTNPSGATVLVDGRAYRGKTPLRVVLLKGKPVEIRLQLYGHNDAYFTWPAENDEVKDNIKLYRLSWYTPR